MGMFKRGLCSHCTLTKEQAAKSGPKVYPKREDEPYRGLYASIVNLAIAQGAMQHMKLDASLIHASRIPALFSALEAKLGTENDVVARKGAMRAAGQELSVICSYIPHTMLGGQPAFEALQSACWSAAYSLDPQDIGPEADKKSYVEHIVKKLTVSELEAAGNLLDVDPNKVSDTSSKGIPKLRTAVVAMAHKEKDQNKGNGVSKRPGRAFILAAAGVPLSKPNRENNNALLEELRLVKEHKFFGVSGRKPHPGGLESTVLSWTW